MAQEFEMESRSEHVAFGRIVVAYDGTEPSKAALDWAAAEAERRSRALTVLHVVDYLSLLPGPFGMVPWRPNPRGEVARRVVAEGKARARISAPTISIAAVVESGQVARTLIETSRDADLIVVGTRGRGDLTGTLLGSVATAVSAHAHCPVVVVRGDSTEPLGPARPVIVAVDESSGADDVLRFAASLAAEAGAPLVVVTVYRLPQNPEPPPQPQTSPPDPDEVVCFGDGSGRPSDHTVNQKIAEQIAEAAVWKVRELYPEIEVRARAILGTTVGQLSTAAHRAGLLVVGSRGLSGIAGLMLGSVSQGVIHSAPCPVAVVGQSMSRQPPAG